MEVKVGDRIVFKGCKHPCSVLELLKDDKVMVEVIAGVEVCKKVSEVDWDATKEYRKLVKEIGESFVRGN